MTYWKKGSRLGPWEAGIRIHGERREEREKGEREGKGERREREKGEREKGTIGFP